jgi:hypothetical protein
VAVNCATIRQKYEINMPYYTALSNILDEMKTYKSFVVWKLVSRNGRATKAPYQTRTGQLASVINPDHWSSFADAISVVDQYDGIGFVFSEHDPYAGIDLDDPNGDAKLIDRQMRIAEEMESYSEVSPSGKGLHIIVRGNVPSGRRRNKIEVYSDGRFFTMTGDVYNDRPIAERQFELSNLWTELGNGRRIEPISVNQPSVVTEEDQAIITRAFSGANGAKFKALWNGDINALKSDDLSAIDQGLVNIIQLYTKNPAQIERIWLASPQGQREKTKSRKDYRDRTVQKAFDMEIPKIEFVGLPTFLSKATAGDTEGPRPLRRELPPSQPFPVDALGPPPREKRCLRLPAGQKGPRHLGHSGMAWPSVDHQHGRLHGAGSEQVQGLLAGVNSGAVRPDSCPS